MRKIYVAAPYTKGDVALNVRYAIQKAELLANYGFAPHVPHLYHFWHLLSPHDYDFWMELDKEFLKVCDAVLRVGGESPGADEEVKLAEELGITVFHSITELVYHFHKK